MSSPRKQETVVPLSLVLAAIGSICLLTAVTIWAAMPAPLPERLELAVAPVWTPRPTTVSPADPDDQAAILLPETPLPSDPAVYRLPSEASLADAPRSLFPAETRSGQPTRLTIPRLELDAPIKPVYLAPVQWEDELYYQWQVPAAYMAGWHNSSAPPGQLGNTILNGHHNIYGQVFRDLADLEAGDEIIVYAEQQPFTYRVEQVLLLPERGESLATRLENAHWIGPTDDKRLTLVSCWPLYDNSHRLIVVAQPTDLSQVSDNQ